MSLKSRLDKLEPRERKMLNALGLLFGVGVVMLIPLGIVSVVGGHRTENEALRSEIEKLYESKAHIAERRAKHDALVARYAKKAPPLAGFLDEAAKAQGITAAESQDRQPIPHGTTKRYSERVTVIKMHKIGLVALSKMLEKIEQSGYPVAVTKLSIKPRNGEPDTYEVELAVSAFDRTPDAPPPGSSASAASSAGPAPSGEAASRPAEDTKDDKDDE